MGASQGSLPPSTPPLGAAGAGDPITVESLNKPASVLVLGALAAKALASVGQITLFVNSKGEVEAAPPGEIQLDGLPEDQAVQKLQAQGYGDPQLLAYLKGRDARQGKGG